MDDEEEEVEEETLPDCPFCEELGDQFDSCPNCGRVFDFDKETEVDSNG